MHSRDTPRPCDVLVCGVYVYTTSIGSVIPHVSETCTFLTYTLQESPVYCFHLRAQEVYIKYPTNSTSPNAFNCHGIFSSNSFNLCVCATVVWSRLSVVVVVLYHFQNFQHLSLTDLLSVEGYLLCSVILVFVV